LFLAGLLLGWQGSSAWRGSAAEGTDGFEVFWEATDRLERLFWYPEGLDPQGMTYGAIQGMLASLGDPYSTFLEPAQHELGSARLQGEFGGIGVELGLEQGRLAVVSVHADSRAEGAGLQAGDEVVRIGDTDTPALCLDEAVALIRGPVGSVVRLVVGRDHTAPFVLEIVRQVIQMPSLAWDWAGPGIGHVHIRFFSDRTSQELAQALSDLAAGDMEALVLDLRGNRGGVVEAATGVLGQLLGRGIAYRELEKGERETRYPVPFNAQSGDWPLAVLVDAGTASSAEIVAAALRDHGRALLYGQTTFGKGSVQAIFPLDDGSSLHLTVARWLTSDGNAIEGSGLQPDVPVASSHEPSTDLVLQTAVADLQSSAAARNTCGTLVPLCNFQGIGDQ
jgi:carboxyl-terminal processing protease